MNLYIILNSFILGFCVNSILIRLQGLKNPDDLIFPVVLVLLSVLSLFLEYIRMKRNR